MMVLDTKQKAEKKKMQHHHSYDDDGFWHEKGGKVSIKV